MNFHNIIKYLPTPIINFLRFMRSIFIKKNEAELSYWKKKYYEEESSFSNSHYEKLMLAIANEQTQEFLTDKIIADFGCGPRGSLCWINTAKLLIGIDVIADQYIDKFYQNISQHNMVYLKSSESFIPLPPNSIDIMFSINALDHVLNFQEICDEIVRVVKPGGEIIFSINLEEPATAEEPQCLNPDIIKMSFLDMFEIKTYRLSKQGPQNSPYQPLINNELKYAEGEEGFLWVRAVKPK